AGREGGGLVVAVRPIPLRLRPLRRRPVRRWGEDRTDWGPAPARFWDEPRPARPRDASAWQALVETNANRAALLRVPAGGSAAGAEEAARASLAAHRRRAEAFPRVELSHASLANACSVLAEVLVSRKKEEAADLWEQSAVSLARCVALTDPSERDREGYTQLAL